MAGSTVEKVKIVDSTGGKLVGVETRGSTDALDVAIVDSSGNIIDEFNESQYTTITTDDANGDIEYVGWAVPGSGDSTDTAIWRIAKITYTSGGNPIAKWASGVATFTKVFDDKLTYIYS